MNIFAQSLKISVCFDWGFVLLLQINIIADLRFGAAPAGHWAQGSAAWFLSPISEVNYQWTSNWWSATVCHCAAVKMGIGVKCHAVHWVRRANSESTIKSRVLGTPQCAPRYKAPSRSLEVGETRAPPDWLYRFPSSLKSHFHISGCCGAWLTVQKKSDLLFPSNESLSPPLFRVQTLSLRKSCTVYSKQD